MPVLAARTTRSSSCVSNSSAMRASLMSGIPDSSNVEKVIGA